MKEIALESILRRRGGALNSGYINLSVEALREVDEEIDERRRRLRDEIQH